MIAPSLRISYDPARFLNERYKNIIDGYESTVSTAEQLVLTEYINSRLYTKTPSPDAEKMLGN